MATRSLPKSARITARDRARRFATPLRHAGLSPAAAARVLEIDEVILRDGCAGKPVPRYVLLALNEIKVQRVREACRLAGQAFMARKLEQIVKAALQAALKPPEPLRLVVDNTRGRS